MERTNKTRIFSVVSTLIIVALAVIVLCAGLSVAPTAYADPTLPFTLVAPKNVTMVKNDGDAPTSMGFAFGITNEMNEFFVGYENAHEAGTLAQYLASKGVSDVDEMWMLAQIDWALDDVDDEVSGWHHNAYWDAAGATGTLGTDDECKSHYSEFGWDVVEGGVNTSQMVTETLLFRGMNEFGWLGGENFVGLREQLRPEQYTFEQYDVDGDVTLSIDWTEHTIYSRVRFVVVLRKDETPDRYVFSDWSAVVAYGKDAETVEPLEPGDVVAPTITGLRLTDEQFNDNPVVAFTLTVPETVAEQKARVAAANGMFRVEVEARVKGTTEWTNLNVAGEVTTGELTAALIYLASPGNPVAAGTEIELRARYLIGQTDRDDFYSGYSKVIGFGSDDISINDTPGSTGTGENNVEPAAKSSCPICHFCPQPLGLCIFIWIIIIIVVLAVAVVAYLIVRKMKKEKEKDKNKQENE